MKSPLPYVALLIRLIGIACLVKAAVILAGIIFDFILIIIVQNSSTGFLQSSGLWKPAPLTAAVLAPAVLEFLLLVIFGFCFAYRALGLAHRLLHDLPFD